MRLKIRPAALVAALVSALAASAANATVTYTFVALSSYPFNGETFTGGYSFTVDDFITSTTTIPVDDLTSCAVTASLGPATCLDQHFYYQVNGPSDTSEAVGLHVNSEANPGSEPYYYFQAGAFEHVGVYDTIYLGTIQQGVLVVTSTSAVPEASSMALTLAGLGLLGGRLRRRR